MSSKSLPFFALISALFLGAACTNSPKSVDLTGANNGGQVNVNVGDQIVIALDSNPSTGYTWEANGLDTTMFEMVSDPTFVSSNPGLVGAGGTLTLTLRTLKAGTATLTLVYHRPWETGVEPVDTFTITVTVK